MATFWQYLCIASALCVALAVTTGDQWHPLSASEMREARGGADCYVDSTSDCPADGDPCSTTDCTQNSAGTYECPSGTTEEKQAFADYANVSLTYDPGRMAKKNLEEIKCTNVLRCSDCEVKTTSSVVCKSTGTGVTQTNSRIPTEVDGDSDMCNEVE